MQNASNITPQADVRAIAAEALTAEGVDAYFPGVDGDHDYTDALARFLEVHRGLWIPAGEDSGWDYGRCDRIADVPANYLDQ